MVDQIGFMDMDIYRTLFEGVSRYLPYPDVQQLFDEIRSDFPIENQPSLEMIHQSTLACAKCSNLSKNAKLPMWNLVDPDVLFVSSTADMSDAGGEIFISALKQSGFSADRCALTYTTRCHKTKNDSFSDQEVLTCAKYLYGEIAHMKPKLIVLLGSKAYMALTGVQNLKLKDAIGNIGWLGQWAYLPIQSPEYIAMNTGMLEDYNLLFRSAYEFCYGTN